jgi:hypothetical protein
LMKRGGMRMPLWVHALAGVALTAMGSFAWLDRDLWTVRPFHYAGEALTGPLVVYVAYLAFATVFRAE